MKKFTVILSLTGALAFAGFLGYAYWLNYGLWAIAVCAATVIALPVSSLLHELGHMLFGVICGIKAVPQFKLFGSSSCKLIPKTDKKLRARIFFTAIGGLVVNLLTVALSVLAITLPFMPLWLSVLAPSSLYLFLLNDMPVEFASGKTDGLICNEVLNNTDSAKVMLAVLTVQAQILKGKPIAEIDEKLLFGVPQIREDDAAFIALTELRYEYCAVLGETEKAEKYRLRYERLKEEYL